MIRLTKQRRPVERTAVPSGALVEVGAFDRQLGRFTGAMNNALTTNLEVAP